MSEAVVLMAYGSPDRIADVPAYYVDIRGGRPIKPEHLEDLVDRYRRLGIEDSNPLNEITEATRSALEAQLGFPVFTGMKHWTPRIADAAERAAEADTVVGLVLAPHYSSLSIAGYREQLEAGLRAAWGNTGRLDRSVQTGTRAEPTSPETAPPSRRLGGRAELIFVESWHDEPGFLELLAERIRGTQAHVVFTAHSLPARILEAGDPYKEQVLETSRLVAARAGTADWTFSFQSESPTGEPWLGPDILHHLDDLHAQGVRDVLVCPVGFVADHLEIRWDLDTEAKDKAHELGMTLKRIEMPNADPAFIRTLATIVERALTVPVAT